MTADSRWNMSDKFVALVSHRDSRWEGGPTNTLEYLLLLVKPPEGFNWDTGPLEWL